MSKGESIKLTKYEKIIFNIVFNAAYKIMDAMTLFKTGRSYPTSYFLAVIAEEELAKLVILPFAKETGDVEEVMTKRKSPFFRHPIKQKIFTSYGLQNRTHEDIEDLKQKCMYVGNETFAKDITEELVYNEIKSSLKLLANLGLRQIQISKHFSKDFKKANFLLMKNIVGGAMDDLMPGIKKEIIEEVSEQDDEIVNLTNEEILKNEEARKRLVLTPPLFIDLIKFVFPKSYKQFFKRILKMSYEEVVKYTDEHIKEHGLK